MGRRALLKFFFITFAISWPCFSAVAAFSAGGATQLSMLRGPILFLGIFAPSIVALSLTARAEGEGGASARRLGHQRLAGGPRRLSDSLARIGN